MKTVKQMTEKAHREFKPVAKGSPAKMITEIVKLRRQVIRTERDLIREQDACLGADEGWIKEANDHEDTKQEHEQALADKQKAHEEEREKQEEKFSNILNGRIQQIDKLKNTIRLRSDMIRTLATNQGSLLHRIVEAVEEQ